MTSRNQSLDVLRGIAVLLVICHHYAVDEGSWLHIGAIGVDLFFVLSGFLISGLLFSELKQTGRIRLSRFFIRRGLKIYPAFYVFLLLTYPLVPRSSGARMVSETLFLQSYAEHIWQHTWSLSVEEMFYLALPLLLVVLGKTGKLGYLPLISVILVAGCLALRLRVPWQEFNRAHLRCDALFAGVAMGYCRAFHSDLFERISRAKWLLPLGVIFLLPRIAGVFVPFQSRMAAVVLTCNFLAFAALMWWSQGTSLKSRILAGIGRYSYSIYLWHMPIAMLFWTLMPRSPLWLAADVLVSIASGVAMALVVETPVLQLRDRVFPSRSTTRENYRPLLAHSGKLLEMQP
jgi:peptidoglycan/LPS O-acetylase OafA/YrhL